jgi:hypothetical protein
MTALENEFTVMPGTVARITGWQARDANGRRWTIIWQPGTGLLRAMPYPAGPVLLALTAGSETEARDAAALMAAIIGAADGEHSTLTLAGRSTA